MALGVFLTSSTTLMFELLITRIFSVTLMYHFAFMAISIAMFGMTAGGVVVYACPKWFPLEKIRNSLAACAFCFGLSVLGSFLIHLAIPITPQGPLLGLYLTVTYLTVSVPFFFSGMCLCLALTRFPAAVGNLYAADMGGAAAGCLGLIALLETTDGPTAAVTVAALGCIAALVFLPATGRRLLQATLIAVVVGLLLLAAVNFRQTRSGHALLALRWIKGRAQPALLHERWNSFSRLAVWGDPDVVETPSGWGMSPRLADGFKVRQLHMDIDAGAYTPIPGFRGTSSELEYLKYDVTNIVYRLRPHAKVAVIGVGGGRDILSALAFDQAAVLGLELNSDIIDIVYNRYGLFTGHVDRFPNVRLIHDEARSWFARHKESFDIIQASLIDTWAATAAGAYVLSENALYTVEAWDTFLRRLTPDGILTFSRWYYRRLPSETYRLAALAVAALRRMGAKEPRRHLAVVLASDDADIGVATLLASRQPLSSGELDTLEAAVQELGFSVLLSPRAALDDTLAAIAEGAKAAYPPLNLTAPTDDSPFFFHTIRLWDSLSPMLRDRGPTSFNTKAVGILALLLAVVIVLTLLGIFLPLALSRTRSLTIKGPPLLYFVGIGFGFMFVEISQMQRLTIFLGHPILGLAVALFSLLLSASLGSWASRRLPSRAGIGLAVLTVLLGLLVVTGVFTSRLIAAGAGLPTPLRIVVAVALMCPAGFFMGMPFPLGMAAAAKSLPDLTPWLWGVNGAGSVCASVLAVAVAMESGISTAFWIGLACYAVAFLVSFFLRPQGRAASVGGKT